jgi:acetolactate synthase-1/2/3 large subunit
MTKPMTPPTATAQRADRLADHLADHLAGRLRALGVARMFGVPGGGSSLDLIAAAERQGIAFVLCRTETGAALMAAVGAELSGAPGVVLTGIGPSAASAVNGVAYASLERAPLILVTDTSESITPRPPHQVFDQQALFAPIAKGTLRLTPDSAGAELDRLLALTRVDPQGPVHLDLSVGHARAPMTAAAAPFEAAPPVAAADAREVEAVSAWLAGARRPVLIAGLQARRAGAPAALRDLAARLGCPVLVSYKAKGVLPETDPHFAGVFTGAAAEGAVLARADAILTLGLDPVEMIPARWTYPAPVGVVMRGVSGEFPFAPAHALDGDLAGNIAALAARASGSDWTPSDWTSSEIADLREGLRERLALKGAGHTAETIVDALVKAARPGTRLAVDAGAHMFSAMARWPATEPHGVLKSNGLSTMGFALPAAIASALHEPERPAVALSGDGGMLMCLAELSTAARLGLPILAVVVNDAALSLIDIKQQRLQFPARGVRYPAVDFAAAARGLGCQAWRVGPGDSFDAALSEALDARGPCLIDVTANPDGYGEQLAALRG